MQEQNKETYYFKIKKGDVEIELRSDDESFIVQEFEKWRGILLKEKRG